MGITKTDGFETRVTEMADLLKALGHPARWAIMEYLAKSPSCICGDIVDELPLAQPTISRHISELKKVGLIQGAIEGKNICYCINTTTWAKVQEALEEVSKNLKFNSNCC